MRSRTKSLAMIFVLILLIGGGIGWFRWSLSRQTQRTSFSYDSSHAAIIALPVKPISVVASMTDPLDAGPLYRQAIQAAQTDINLYGKFARSARDLRDLDDIPAIELLIRAAHSADADLFQSHPREIVTLSHQPDALEALRILATCATRAGALMESSQPQRAMQLYEAVFSLGDKLYRERLTYDELNLGLSLLAEGSALIASADPSRVSACRAFDDARKKYVIEQLTPTHQVVQSIDLDTLGPHAGDVAYFAQHSPERMWRVESIFSLGRYRFNAALPGDQRRAASLLEILTHDSDPIVRCAAVEAADLTIEQYRMLH